MKWYPSDWRGEALVRACEPLARYVWMEMLGLMHEAEPYGHLVFAGRAMDYGTLSRLIGVDSGDVKRAVKQLEAVGVFSRTDKGVIYSRRMLRDKKKADLARENGGNGGNPSLQNQTLRQGRDNPPDNHTVKGWVKPQKPEANAQVERKKESSAVVEPPTPPPEDRPKAASPKRGKPDLDGIEAALREAAGLQEDPSPGLFNLAPILGLIDAGYRLDEDIVPAVRSVAATGRKGRVWTYYVPAVTEAAKARTQAGASPAPAPQKPAETPESTWRMKFNAWRDHQYWPAAWGPPPGRYGCPMPQALIDLWTQEKTA